MARVQSTNISWSRRASSQLQSWSVNGAIVVVTPAAAGSRFCLILKQSLAGVNSRRVDLQAWQCGWCNSCLSSACNETRDL